MRLYDYHWIGKGCTVEILYGEHRTFIVQKTFKVVSIDTTIPRDYHGCNTIIVDVYGEHLRFIDASLKLIDKPGYTRIKDGEWKANYMIGIEDTKEDEDWTVDHLMSIKSKAE